MMIDQPPPVALNARSFFSMSSHCGAAVSGKNKHDIVDPLFDHVVPNALDVISSRLSGVGARVPM